jgi:hypothetical protein
MGGTSWNTERYTANRASLSARGMSDMAYTDNVIRHTPVAEQRIHQQLNPFGVNRESRDSEAHPTSRAVAVMFDVTGSMRNVPRIAQGSLPRLMDTILRGVGGRPFLEHPQILIGAVGDAYNDKAVLQVGQFESGLEISEDLSKLWLEGGGGGTYEESYELAMYFLARHTACDCIERRNERGYAFILGDEHCYPRLRTDTVRTIFGDELGQEIDLAAMVLELQDKWDTFFILPNGTTHYNDAALWRYWVQLLGSQQCLRLEQPNRICDLIASTIGIAEGVLTPDGVSAAIEPGADAEAVVTATAHLAGRPLRRIRIPSTAA